MSDTESGASRLRSRRALNSLIIFSSADGVRPNTPLISTSDQNVGLLIAISYHREHTLDSISRGAFATRSSSLCSNGAGARRQNLGVTAATAKRTMSERVSVGREWMSLRWGSHEIGGVLVNLGEGANFGMGALLSSCCAFDAIYKLSITIIRRNPCGVLKRDPHWVAVLDLLQLCQAP